MPNLTIDLPVENLANLIKNLKQADKSKLFEYLFAFDNELQNRNCDIENNPEQFVTKDEVFGNLS